RIEYLPGGNCPQDPHSKFDERIPPTDRGPADAAAATEDEPTEERHVLRPGERVGAVAAMGAGLDDALAVGPAAQAHVQKAAKGQSDKASEDRSRNANHFRG